MSANTPQWNQLFQYEDGQIELADNRGIPVLASPPRKRPKPTIDQRHDEKQEAATAG